MNRQPIPLRHRLGDLLILAFFTINLLFITYMVDFEQLVIPDPAHFTYPAWPPARVVDAVHWWGSTYDPALMARQPWWLMTIWIDVLFFGPFYVFGIYAFLKGKEWIRIPSIIYSSMLLTNVLIILNEERYGPYATPHWPVVATANLPWLLFPIFILLRMGLAPHPFTSRTEPGGEIPERSATGETAAPTGNQ